MDTQPAQPPGHARLSWPLRRSAVTRAYAPGAPGPRREGICELASNENPHGASPAALAAVERALSRSHRYPEHDAGSLRARLAQRWDLSPEHVMVTPGTTPLIELIARAFLCPGVSAVVSERSFLAYTTAVEATGADLVLAPMRDDHIDLDAVLGAIRPDTRLIFLANPNNPTGTAFVRAAFDAFLDRVPEHVLVVLDEAYAEYAEGVLPLPDGAAYVREARPVMALRTFSKVYGLAGLRVGYGLGSPELIRELSRRTAAFGVSHAAQLAAAIALEDHAHVRRSTEANREGVAALTAGLVAMRLAPAPSAANFVYVDLGRPAEGVQAALLSAGVRVRALHAWGAPTAIRITVGAAEDVRRVLRELEMAIGVEDRT